MKAQLVSLSKGHLLKWKEGNLIVFRSPYVLCVGYLKLDLLYNPLPLFFDILQMYSQYLLSICNISSYSLIVPSDIHTLLAGKNALVQIYFCVYSFTLPP